MENIQVYHNPRCSKSRMAIDYLKAKSIEFDIVLYLEQKPSASELKSVLNKLKLAPSELLRKGEDVYKTQVKNKDLTDDELIQLMINYPNLIERPIIINGDKAIIARPTELIQKII